jgi:hypothetical protein
MNGDFVELKKGIYEWYIKKYAKKEILPCLS